MRRNWSPAKAHEGFAAEVFHSHSRAERFSMHRPLCVPCLPIRCRRDRRRLVRRQRCHYCAYRRRSRARCTGDSDEGLFERKASILIEQFLDGYEASVFCFVVNESWYRCRLPWTTRRSAKETPEKTPAGGLYRTNPKLSETAKEKIYKEIIPISNMRCWRRNCILQVCLSAF